MGTLLWTCAYVAPVLTGSLLWLTLIRESVAAKGGRPVLNNLVRLHCGLVSASCGNEAASVFPCNGYEHSIDQNEKQDHIVLHSPIFINVRETSVWGQQELRKSKEKISLIADPGQLCASDNDSSASLCKSWPIKFIGRIQFPFLHPNLSMYSQFYYVCICWSMSLNTFLPHQLY